VQRENVKLFLRELCADGGTTWTPIGDVPTKAYVQSVAADPWTTGVLMANAQDGILMQIYKSADTRWSP